MLAARYTALEVLLAQFVLHVQGAGTGRAMIGCDAVVRGGAAAHLILCDAGRGNGRKTHSAMLCGALGRARLFLCAGARARTACRRGEGGAGQAAWVRHLAAGRAQRGSLRPLTPATPRTMMTRELEVAWLRMSEASLSSSMKVLRRGATRQASKMPRSATFRCASQARPTAHRPDQQQSPKPTRAVCACAPAAGRCVPPQPQP